jgi:transaldolase/glucose-6-phosphate isomerase
MRMNVDETPKVARGSNPLRQLSDLGQSVWLDCIRQSLISSGELQRLIHDDGLRGITSNPAIFEQAIAGSREYADLIGDSRARGLDAVSIYETLAVRDIQEAADLLRPVYDSSQYRDGYVSFEVSPFLAHDTPGTLVEARRLSRRVARDNLMIKVPATPEGIAAFEQLTAEGIGVNVTLLFSQRTYERVAQAYIRGLRRFAQGGGELNRVASVASFFVSRIDSAVDEALARRARGTQDRTELELLSGLGGKIAIANAKLAYQRYRELFADAGWRALEAKGAQPQRLLWASTGTKNPSYRDVMYVEELVGPNTVNTIPPTTLAAFRDHGVARARLEKGIDEARTMMDMLVQAGISIDEVAKRLLDEGLLLFRSAFDELLKAVDLEGSLTAKQPLNPLSFSLPHTLQETVAQITREWAEEQKLLRLWSGDASLWTNSDESTWLGWLGIVVEQLADVGRFQRLAEVGKRFDHLVLLGMGGSSLAPEVIHDTFGRSPTYPEFLVLDSTDPEQVRAIEARIDVTRTLFIVASKSGGTLEPNLFRQYFFARTFAKLGSEESARRFIAITDPGSALDRMARREGFSNICHGVPSIGWRFSALSDFGLVPAALMGVDVRRLLVRAREMVHACMPAVPTHLNPAVLLGVILGAAAQEGRNKLTIIASPALSAFGAWLEQLVAESTGKDGKGIVPVDRERVGSPNDYGRDRLFVYLRSGRCADPEQDHAMDALERHGEPIIRIAIAESYDLGAEFFRWEIAVAVAGAVIRVNPFNQPDVEASKQATHRLTEEYQRSGSLPPEQPFFSEGGISLFTDRPNAQALRSAVGEVSSLAAYLTAHHNRIVEGDYYALLAYVDRNAQNEAQLQAIRHAVRDAKRVATCLGFGPRFLHSTGQLYKGGPNGGVILQITCDDLHDLPVPGQRYTFGVVKAAQARADFGVLAARTRRVLRVHLSGDVPEGLTTLAAAMSAALR